MSYRGQLGSSMLLGGSSKIIENTGNATVIHTQLNTSAFQYRKTMNMTTFHRSHSLGRSEKVEGFLNFGTDSTRGVHISVRRINVKVKHSNWLKN